MTFRIHALLGCLLAAILCLGLRAQSFPRGMFGEMPAYGFFFRRVTGLEVRNVKLDTAKPDHRPAFALHQVNDAWFHHLNVEAPAENPPLFDLRAVTDFRVQDSRYTEDRESGDSGDRLRLDPIAAQRSVVGRDLIQARRPPAYMHDRGGV